MHAHAREKSVEPAGTRCTRFLAWCCDATSCSPAARKSLRGERIGCERWHAPWTCSAQSPAWSNIVKKAAALTLLFVATVGLVAVSQTTELSELESLRRMDALGEKAPAPVAVVRDAFRTVNEEALGYLPVMPVLYVENAVAGATLSAADTAAKAETTLANLFPSAPALPVVAAPVAAVAVR